MGKSCETMSCFEFLVWRKRTLERFGSTNTGVRVAFDFWAFPRPLGTAQMNRRRGRAVALSPRFAPRPFSLALQIISQIKRRASPNGFATSIPNANCRQSL